MKALHTLTLSLLLLGLTAAMPALAQPPAPPATAATAASQAEPPWTEGEVRRIDLPGKKITLRHGEIRNLDMPPMSMVFGLGRLAPEQLAGLKVGDRLRFQAERIDGKLELSALQR